ncbi:uncharacterized mitochondrial protein AtMg00810-like [Malus domestica]|uniref:uncharacterized mitochondrial protein AtMg00810-like n=1 Tax=Malus domestica TaxID=3750 RepID=UPI003976F815
MIITGDDSEKMMKLEQNLVAEFEMNNLEDLKYFLGVEVARSSKGNFLSQRKYVMDLLKETGMLGCKPVDIPIVEKHYLGIYPNQEPIDKGRYQRLVGRLIYLSHTRPDIAYVVSVVSQCMHSPSVDHMAAVMRILAYLKSALGKAILYEYHGHMRIEGFTDVNWAGDVTDRRSTSGYFTFVGGNLVTWRSKKQNVVSWSSAEVVYRGMAHGVCEILWLRKLLWSRSFKHKEAMKLYCDNKSSREIAGNPVQHDRTKHVEVNRHFIKEKLKKKIVSIPFMNSKEQLVDILTHVVCSRRFNDSLVKLGMTAMGDRFITCDITYVNNAGLSKHQAVALRAGADKSVIFQCSVVVYQDTLYTHSKSQFNRDTQNYITQLISFMETQQQKL